MTEQKSTAPGTQRLVAILRQLGNPDTEQLESLLKEVTEELVDLAPLMRHLQRFLAAGDALAAFDESIEQRLAFAVRLAPAEREARCKALNEESRAIHTELRASLQALRAYQQKGPTTP